MPLQKCTDNGKSGYKWGDSGHCYTGPGAKKKALKQGQAIEINKHAKGEKNELNVVNAELIACEKEESILEQTLSNLSDKND